MSANTAELTLIIRAQNLAEGAFNSVKTQMTGIVTTAKVVARDMATAFKGIGKRIGSQLGNIATDILSGGSLANNMVYLGATMAGAVVEGLSAHLLPMLLEKLGKTALFAPLATAMAAGGVTLGTVLTTAIGVGMAAAPFVLLAAAVAALVYLAVNPEARQKAREVALMIIGKIGDGLHDLGVVLIGIFTKAFNGVLGVARRIVNAIIDVILAIPRAVAAALAALGALGSKQFQVSPGRTPRHAEGGWVGLHGPELGILGERGPEYVVPNHQLSTGRGGGGAGVTLLGVSEREILDMVDRGLYFRLQRSAPTSGRT